MGRYVIEGQLRKSNNRTFIQTAVDEYNNPVGCWVDKVIGNIPENTEITIVIDFGSKVIKE